MEFEKSSCHFTITSQHLQCKMCFLSRTTVITWTPTAIPQMSRCVQHRSNARRIQVHCRNSTYAAAVDRCFCCYIIFEFPQIAPIQVLFQRALHFSTPAPSKPSPLSHRSSSSPCFLSKRRTKQRKSWRPGPCWDRR